jgi:glycosyltransferase involved in cell wall biosynthesis
VARTLGNEDDLMTGIRVALLACTNVIGGHEFQVAALGRDLANHVEVSIFVNHVHHANLFEDAGLSVGVAEGLLLEPGALPRQCLNGWRRGHAIRTLVEKFDHIIVCAGSVEAGISVGLALRGYKPTSMYLPFFYDRVPVWGWKGHLYNCLLARASRLFDRIITINRIQAKVIRAFSGVLTFVVTNKIRDVQPPVQDGPARLVFVGRLDHQKRVDELIRWLDTDTNPISELVLIGDGPLRSQLEQQAQTLRYLKCSFLGWKSPEEQDRLIRSSDILVLNSLLEGEPLVIREARARGMPIAARDIVGTRGVTLNVERFTSQQTLIELLKIIRFSCESAYARGPNRINITQEKFRRDRNIATLARIFNS